MSVRACERGRMFNQQLPRAVRVCRGRAEMTDGDADRERPVEASMREKYFSARIYRVEHALVEAVELRWRDADSARSRSKADRRERNRCEAFQVRMVIHPRGELLSEADVLAKDLAQALRTKMPKNHPK